MEADKSGDKDGKALHKVMNNAVYGKTLWNLRNRIDVRIVSNERKYWRWTSKPSYMSRGIFDNCLVAIRKRKVILTLNKSVYVGMCISDLSKILFTDNDSLMYGIKTEDVYKDFSKDKEIWYW